MGEAKRKAMARLVADPLIRKAQLDAYVPPTLRSTAVPKGWRLIDRANDGFSATDGLLMVVVSVAKQLDSKRWQHVSVSIIGRNDLPSWVQMVEVKNAFCGKEATAIIVIPPRSKHVSFGEVHHLWVCLDGDVLPDFTSGLGTI